MTTTTADTIAQAGISYPTATVIAGQMAAGAPTGGVADRLVAAGIPPQGAIELAAEINAGAFSAHNLCLAGFNTITAKVIKTASGL